MDASHVATIIQSQFPELSLTHVSRLGEGCDSVAFEVDGRWVFRFPKRAEVAEQLLLESRVLSVLAVGSPLALPVSSFHGRPSDLFSYCFVGYRKLPGTAVIQLPPQVVPQQHWVPMVGRCLSWLHGFPIVDAIRLGVKPREISVILDEVRSDALGDFEVLRDLGLSTSLDRWRAFLEDRLPSSTTSSPCVLAHCDLAAEHILWDSAQQIVTGIIDWSDMAITDRSIDLAGFFHWGGEPCLSAALSGYERPIDEGVLARARYLAACRGVSDVAFGLQTGRQEYITAGLRALGFIERL